MNTNKDRWIKEGYSLLAKEGPSGIQVERLARIIGVNKSGFYHHFGDRDCYLEELTRYHENLTKKFTNEVIHLKHFDPDYFEVLVEYKDSFFVDMHLGRYRVKPKLVEASHNGRNLNEKKIIPLWEEYLNITGNHDLAYEIWKVVRDAVFLRLTYNDMNVESINNAIKEIKGIFEKLKKAS
jgi:AcrR family transcriptional regulator